MSQGFNSVMHSNNFTAGDLFIKFVLFNFSFYLIALLKILKVGSISFYTLDIFLCYFCVFVIENSRSTGIRGIICSHTFTVFGLLSLVILEHQF